MEKYEKDGLFNSDYSDYIKGKNVVGYDKKKDKYISYLLFKLK